MGVVVDEGVGRGACANLRPFLERWLSLLGERTKFVLLQSDTPLGSVPKLKILNVVGFAQGFRAEPVGFLITNKFHLVDIQFDLSIQE